MGFRTGAFAKVWNTTEYEKYTNVEMSTSKKNKATDSYETDFSSKFVRFIGDAHRDAQALQNGAKIKLGDCEVTNKYDKEKKREYTNFCVYSFELVEAGNGQKGDFTSTEFLNIPDDVVGDLPFA